MSLVCHIKLREGRKREKKEKVSSIPAGEGGGLEIPSRKGLNFKWEKVTLKAQG